MAAKRKLFSQLESKGPNGQADVLYTKYQAHIKKKGGDITDLADLEANGKDYGLANKDVDWIGAYDRTRNGFNYPDNGILLTIYKQWYKSREEITKYVGDNHWDTLFMTRAVSYNSDNEGKSYNRMYLRRKIQKILDAIEAKTGKSMPNPVKSAGKRVSVEQAVSGDDLSWCD